MAFARQVNRSFATHLELEQVRGIKQLTQATGTPCTVHSSDLRVRVAATGLTTYPDVTTVRGPAETDLEISSTVTNPSGQTARLDPLSSTLDVDQVYCVRSKSA